MNPSLKTEFPAAFCHGRHRSPAPSGHRGLSPGRPPPPAAAAGRRAAWRPRPGPPSGAHRPRARRDRPSTSPPPRRGLSGPRGTAGPSRAPHLRQQLLPLPLPLLSARRQAPLALKPGRHGRSPPEAKRRAAVARRSRRTARRRTVVNGVLGNGAGAGAEPESPPAVPGAAGAQRPPWREARPVSPAGRGARSLRPAALGPSGVARVRPHRSQPPGGVSAAPRWPHRYRQPVEGCPRPRG